jgi:DHA2 family multidrug resistance protein-like MFS transporter
MSVAPNTNVVVGCVPRPQAGMAAGMLMTSRQVSSVMTSRQVSSALGVAVVGSLLVWAYRAELSSTTASLDLSEVDRTATRRSLNAALEVADRVGGDAGRALATSARDSFVRGFHVGTAVCAAILVAAAAALALRYLPARHTDSTEESVTWIPVTPSVD